MYCRIRWCRRQRAAGLVLRDKAALARAGGSIALRHHGGCYGDFPGVQIVLIDLERSATVTAIDGVLDVSSQGNSPQPALRLLPRVTFAVTVVSSFDNAMFGASGSPQIFSDGDAADSALQLILLWALTVAVMAVPSEMSLLLNVNDSSVAVLPVSLVCGAPAP